MKTIRIKIISHTRINNSVYGNPRYKGVAIVKHKEAGYPYTPIDLIRFKTMSDSSLGYEFSNIKFNDNGYSEWLTFKYHLAKSGCYILEQLVDNEYK